MSNRGGTPQSGGNRAAGRGGRGRRGVQPGGGDNSDRNQNQANGPRAVGQNSGGTPAPARTPAQPIVQPSWDPNPHTMRPTTGLVEQFLNSPKDKRKTPLGIIYRPAGGKPPPSKAVHEMENAAVEVEDVSPLTKALMLNQQIARRPGYGKGTVEIFYTNHLVLGTTGPHKIYRYRVDIEGFEKLKEAEEARKSRADNSNLPTPSRQGRQSAQANAPSQPTASALPTRSGKAGTSNNTSASTDTGVSTEPDASSQAQPTIQQGLVRKRRRMFEILLKEDVIQAAGMAVATDYAGIILTATKLDLSKEISILYYAEDNPTATSQASNRSKVTLKLEKELTVQELKDYLESPFSSQHAEASKEIIQALNIILKKAAAQTSGVVVGAGNSIFYPMRGESDSLNACLVALRGFYASVKTSTGRLLVNLNVRTSAFYQEGRVDAAIKVLERAGKDPMALLKKRRVTTKYQGTTKYKVIYGFRENPKTKKPFNARTAMLTPRKDEIFDGTEEVCVLDYFRRKHGITIDEPHLPLLNLGPIRVKTASNDGVEATGTGSGTNNDAAGVTESDSNNDATGAAEFSSNSTQQSASSPRTPEDNVIGYQLVPQQCCCIVPGQSYGKKLVAEMKPMLKFAATPPAENARRIVHAAELVFDLTVDNPCLKGFGLRVEPELVTLYGRHLNQPTIRYRDNKSPRNFPGSWNLAPYKLLTSGSSVQWCYMQLGHDTTFYEHEKPPSRSTKILPLDWKGKISSFRGHLERCGLRLPEPFSKERRLTIQSEDKAIREFLQGIKGKGIKIMLVILRDDNAFNYSRLKFISELEFGIHTVCTTIEKFIDKWVREEDVSYVSNLALKFNLKLGGENHEVNGATLADSPLKNTMVMGIDVSHPSNTRLKEPRSIAGVVANTAAGKFGQWPCSLRTQSGGVEIVQWLEEMVTERLNAWSSKTPGKWPDRILVYRDGVSESQYDAVLEKELVSINNACRTRVGRELPVALVVVAKRHHTRFYPSDEKFADRLGNPLPGFITDRAVTMETGWDFYLQAHSCIQGTAKPAHYVVLHNGFGRELLNATNLEIITHELSYLFGRATKAVSICAPAYYAHVACERGKVYLHKYYHDKDTPDGSTWSDAAAPWMRTFREDVRDGQGQVTYHRDLLAEQMFYI